MDDQLEPGSEFHAANGDVQTHALVSIAFSLKRIADSLRYHPDAPDTIYGAINDIRHNTRGAP